MSTATMAGVDRFGPFGDLESVRDCRSRERGGIALRNCPPYIREWIAREREQP